MSDPNSDTTNNASTGDAGSVSKSCPMQNENISIVPVRYAIDDIDYKHQQSVVDSNGHETDKEWWDSFYSDDVVETKQKNSLPEEGNWKGPFNLQHSKYTLRRLRDGWLYVYDQNAKTFHEYQVDGATLTKYDWGSDEANKSPDDRGSAGEAKPYLSYPSKHTLYLGFSAHRWTWRVCEHMRSSGSSRSKWMRKLDLSKYCTSLNDQHADKYKNLAKYVADIYNDTAPDDDMFKTRSVALVERDLSGNEISSRAELVATKAAASISEYTVDEKQSACFVALDDRLADLTDIILNLSLSWAGKEAVMGDDDNMHKFQMAEIVRGIGRIKIPYEKLPKNCQDDPIRALALEEQVNKYLKLNRESENSILYHPNVNMQALETANEARAIKSDISETYQFSISADMEKQWSERHIYQDEVNWSGLDDFLKQHYQDLAGKDELIEKNFDEALAVLNEFRKDALAVGIDTQYEQDIAYLLDYTAQISGILTISCHNEEMKCHLQKSLSLSSPKNLFSLAGYGFSEDNQLAIEAQISELKKKALSSQSPDDVTAIASVLGNWQGLAGDARVQDQSWYQALSAPVKASFAALVKAVNDIATESWQSVMDILLPTQSSGTKGTISLVDNLRGVILESMMNSSAVLALNKNYATEFADFSKKLLVYVKERADILNVKPGQQVSSKHLANSVAAVDRKIRELFAKEMPFLIQLKNQALNARAQQVLNGHLGAFIDGSKAVAGKLIGQWGRIFIILGGWNVVAALDGIQNKLAAAKGWSDTAKAILEPIYDSFYTLQFVYAGALDRTWGLIERKGLLELTVKTAGRNSKSNIVKLLASRFVSVLKIVSIAGFIASVLETFDSALKFEDPLNSGMENVGYFLKGGATFANAAVFGAQLFNLVRFLFNRVALGAIFGPWMAITLAVSSVVYLISLVIINIFHRTDLEKWLLQSVWGKQTANWSHEQEIKNLEKIIYRPVAKLEKVTKVSKGTTNRRGFTTTLTTSHWQLNLCLPIFTWNRKIGLQVSQRVQTSNHGQMRHFEYQSVDVQKGSISEEQDADNRSSANYSLKINSLNSVKVILEMPLNLLRDYNTGITYQGTNSSEGKFEFEELNDDCQLELITVNA